MPIPIAVHPKFVDLMTVIALRTLLLPALILTAAPLFAQRPVAEFNDWDTTFSLAGPDGPVNAMVVVGDDIYVGGKFRTAGRVMAQNIARYNRTERRWHSLDGGVHLLDSSWRQDSSRHKSEVHELVVIGDDIYVGGEFERAGDDVAAFGVARWNMREKRWNALEGTTPTGLFQFGVRGLAISGDRLFAGGWFAGEYEFVTGLVEYNMTTQVWSIPDPSLKDTLRTLAIDDRFLYVGYAGAPGGKGLTGGLKRRDLQTGIWTSMGNGVQYFDYPNYKARPIIETIRVDGDWVFVGGRYFIEGQQGGSDTTSNSIARWHRPTERWEKTGLGPTYSHADNDTSIAVRDLVVHDNYLYIVGDFDEHEWLGRMGVARWSLTRGGEWEHIGDRTRGVRAIAAGGGEIYIGGRFQTFDSLPSSRVARLEEPALDWKPLAEPGSLGAMGTVWAMAASGGRIYVGGNLQAIGIVPVNHIAEIDTATGEISSMNGGVDGAVRSLLVRDGVLYVGGGFDTAGGSRAKAVARWDINARRWDSLGSGVGENARRDTVRALAADNDYLYAGGDYFWSSGRGPGSILRYSFADGTWDSVGVSTYAQVNALHIHNGELYAGGAFTSMGSWPAQGIARWDGEHWFPVGEGFRGTVYAMATYKGDLYVGGEELHLPGFTQGYGLLRWDGSTWDRPDSALINDVAGLRVEGEFLYAVGTRWFGVGRSTPQRVFRWNGRNWSGLGAGIGIYSDRVEAIASEGGSIWVGGNLHFMDGSYYWRRNRPTQGLARWSPWLAAPVAHVPGPANTLRGISIAPNPSSGDVAIGIPEGIAGIARLSIADPAGRIVARMSESTPGVAERRIVWRTDGLARGIYFYRLTIGQMVATGTIFIYR